jgi:hypothetical protein
MIGKLRNVVFDAPDPLALAEFYHGLLGGEITSRRADWCTVVSPSGQSMSFQRSPEHRPPTFPDPAASQQLHLDVEVTDVDAAERQVLALGATRLANEGEQGDTFRVFADPAGHPFCLVWDL